LQLPAFAIGPDCAQNCDRAESPPHVLILADCILPEDVLGQVPRDLHGR
jgi:hypothetical protein